MEPSIHPSPVLCLLEVVLVVCLSRLLHVLHGSEIQEVRRSVQLVVEALRMREKETTHILARGGGGIEGGLT